MVENYDILKPFITVVIPTYNCADYLKRALDSVFSQTYQNFEVIVVDNSSTDNTEDVLNSFDDKRLTVIKVNNNGIIAHSRNKGIENAKGEWIAFLDSDDVWYQEKLKIVINAILGDTSIDVCSTDELQVNVTTGIKTLLNYGPYCPDFYQMLLLNGNRLSTSATLVKREFLTKYGLFFREKKEFVTVEDYDFWLLMARAGAKFKFIESIQGEYIIHTSNASGQSDLHQQNGLNVYHDHVYNLQSFQPDKNKLWRYINSRILISNAKNMLTNRRYVSASKFIISAFRGSFIGALSYILFKLIKSYKR